MTSRISLVCAYLGNFWENRGSSFFVLALLVAAARYYQLYPMDDAAFFFRYAEHLASGAEYRWNIGLAGPVGASAPLWPPIIALVMLLGLPAYIAALVIAIACLSASFLLLFQASVLLWGNLSPIILFLGIAASPWILGCAMGGMETSLTVLLLSLSFFAIAANKKSPYGIVALAALLVIEKIDLAPWAIGLLVATGFNPLRRKNCMPMALGAAIVALYLIAFWRATGFFVPISFVRKLVDSAGTVHEHTESHWWFLRWALFSPDRWPIATLAGVASPFVALRQRRIFYFFIIGFVGQTIAYTAFPPTESFVWYLAPSVLAVNFMASGFLSAITPLHWKALALVSAIGLGVNAFAKSESARHWFINNSEYTEADRARAGQWVATHTPESFRLATGWGNPAFYSKRLVYDVSGLNMGGKHSLDYILATYKPEVIILCPFKTKKSPQDWDGAPAGYEVVKGFASAYESKENDFYALVAVRQDVESQLGPRTYEESQ